MVYRCSSLKWPLKEVICSIFLVLFIVTPLKLTANTITLTKNGPLTAREGDLIEYQLKAVNENNAGINNVQILDILPAEVDFVEAVSTLSGIYEPSTGIWEIPILGTTDVNKTAVLQLRVLVKTSILSDPMNFITATNYIALVSPAPTEPKEVEHSTYIVCASCIDWEIVSIILDSEWRGPDTLEPFEMRYFLYVTVANNGPVASQGSLTSTYFNVSYAPSLTLQPSLPITVSLDVGKKKTYLFETPWREGPTSTYTVAWEFAMTDDALLDPVEPNTVSGTWTGKVTDGGGRGCFIATAAYGSRLNPHIQSLREFRDKTLMRSWIGRKFISIYYEFSPPIARYIEQSEFLKKVTRTVLIPVIFIIETPFLAFTVFGGISFLGLKIRRYRKSTHNQRIYN